MEMMRPADRWKGPSWTDQFALPRTRLGLALVSLAVIFFSVNFGEKVATSIRANQQVADLRQQIATINRQNADLQRQIKYYETDAYVIKTARENYLYKQPGDTVFRVVDAPEGTMLSPSSSPPSPAPNATPSSDPWWQRLLHLFGQ